MANRPSLLIVSFLALAQLGSSGTAEVDFMRGMTVSCPRSGQIWASPAMKESLRELATLGVEWIAIHPYAGVARDGEIRAPSGRRRAELERAGDLIRNAGMKAFWKPHLAYWGSFGWRGEIEFGADEEAWERFFSGYEAFIVDQARLAQSAGAGLFAVGVEIEMTTHRQERWRTIIAAVREVYDGQITYGANWDRLDRVPFWDAVDLIGVQAYFPLARVGEPRAESWTTAWDGPVAELRSLSAAEGGKQVVFTEIGYNRSAAAATEPWDYAMDDEPASRRLRQELMAAALERFEAEPLIRGMFWWKWMPGRIGGGDRDFSMRDAEARSTLAAWWARS